MLGLGRERVANWLVRPGTQCKAMVSPFFTPFRDPYCFEHQTSLTAATFKGFGPYWYCETCQATSADDASHLEA